MRIGTAASAKTYPAEGEKTLGVNANYYDLLGMKAF